MSLIQLPRLVSRTHYVFDGDNLLHRMAYMSGYSSGKKSPVFNDGTLYAFLGAVRHVAFSYMPQRVSVVWDGGRSARRMSMYPEYKRTPIRESRTASDIASFKEARSFLTRVLRKLGVRVFLLPAREGDDVVRWLADNAGPIVVVSDDTDFYQLLPSGSAVFHPSKKFLVSDLSFLGEFGYLSNQYVLYKCLVGDSSDNISGVPKIGEKTATAILSANPSVSTPAALFEVLGSLDLTPARMKALKESRGVLDRNWGLITLGDDFTTTECMVLQNVLDSSRPFDPSSRFDLLGLVGAEKVPFESWSDPFRGLH